MRAGTLNRRVNLQQSTPTRDSYGYEVDSWATVDTVYASILPLRGEEYTAGRALEAMVTHRIITRYRTDITPTTDWRITHTDRAGGTQTFDIESIQEAATRGRMWVFMCREQV